MISVRFLGTGGARFVVAKQIRASGGMWMRFGETQIHIDPGPGALVRALGTGVMREALHRGAGLPLLSEVLFGSREWPRPAAV